MKTLNYIAIYSCSLIIISIISSCNLDLKLQNNLSDPDIIVDANTERNVLVPAYLNMPDNLPFKLSLLASDFQITGFANGDPNEKKLYNWSPRDMQFLFEDTWTSFYLSISDINNLLERANKIISKIEKRRIQDYRHVIGEAYLLKAYDYFCLLRLYATPYSDKSRKLSIVLRNNVPEDSGNRATKDETLKEIFRLIDMAEKYLTGNTSTKNSSHYILNLPALYQIKANVHLYMGDYENCIKDCQEFYKLVPKETISVKNYLSSFWTGQNISATTWNRQVFRKSFYQAMFGQDLPHYERQCYLIAQPLIPPKTDIRYSSYTIENAQVPEANFDSPMLGKYNISNTINHKYLTSYCELRPTQVIYMEAESLIETNRTNEANKILTQYYAGEDFGISNEKSLKENRKIFRLKKQQEFVGEGLNYYDLKRWNLPRIEYSSSGGVLVTMSAGEHRFTWAIPASEMKYNDNITVQNEGWPIYKIKRD